MDRLKLSRIAVNAITCYRIIAAPVLLWLIFGNQLQAFKWLLVFSFFSDAVDGHLARRYKAVSIMGSRLDSLGDDLTVGVAIAGLIKWHLDFIADHWVWVVLLGRLFCLQLATAILRYGKMTAFYTYIAKVAVVLQATFLLACFFFGSPSAHFFRLVSGITALGLLEEIVLISLLPDYRFNVKGLYWILKDKEVFRRYKK